MGLLIDGPARTEASTESEWVARHLESLGHEVIVADPNFAPMYATRSRRTKTDKRDARALMDACETGAYRPAYRLADGRRHVRAQLAVRALSPTLADELAPLFAVYGPLNEQIAAADIRLAALAHTDPIVRLLTTAPGVGSVTAAPALYADVALAKQLFDWEARYTEPDDIIATAWNWHRKNPRGYASSRDTSP